MINISKKWPEFFNKTYKMAQFYANYLKCGVFFKKPVFFVFNITSNFWWKISLKIPPLDSQ